VGIDFEIICWRHGRGAFDQGHELLVRERSGEERRATPGQRSGIRQHDRRRSPIAHLRGPYEGRPQQIERRFPPHFGEGGTGGETQRLDGRRRIGCAHDRRLKVVPGLEQKLPGVGEATKGQREREVSPIVRERRGSQQREAEVPGDQVEVFLPLFAVVGGERLHQVTGGRDRPTVMAAANFRGFATDLEMLMGKGVDRLEHAPPAAQGMWDVHKQALVGQAPDHIAGRGPIALTDDRGHCGEVERSGEDAQAAEGGALGVVEQLVTPVDDRP
jgi:hypothetical protein